ncbi:Alpha/Beta hydrolase protein [Collybia nuda]|uniref:Alpha/Beta hydrolase protein n=1 Tax=Collybia nuda TaxID=64659 RepID=A0A9P6CD57_9AGAR|nr:Alpha/Beta hydrolase protein [Collybia nuda]
MLTSTPRQYGDASLTEKLALIASLFLHLPFALAWALLISPFNPSNANKSWKRVLLEKISSFSCEQWSIASFQWLLGDTYYAYVNWTKKNNLPVLADDIGENARLLWVGRARTDRVILYFHGGGFHFPLTSFGAGFWKHTLTELQDRGVDAGLVILNYSLAPAVSFPTPLKQAVRALEHLISIGVSPENIQITGDSAGANLALQLISHLLHPLDGIPHIKLSAPIRGVYLMSPWVSMPSLASVISSTDSVVSGKAILGWGRQIMGEIPESQRCYIEVGKAPKTWFKNAKTVVHRVLMTIGEEELLREDDVVFADQFCRDHDGARYIMQKNGVHVEPYFDFFDNGPNVSKSCVAVWDWLADGFKEDS